MKNLSTTLVLFLLLFFQSCSEKDKEECDGPCTEEYRIITVSIQDDEGNSVALDGFEVINIRNERELTIKLADDVFELMRERGSYPIFSDEYQQEYEQQQLELE